MNNKILNIRNSFLLFAVSLMVIVLMPACKKDKLNVPVIKSVRNYAAAPGDSIVQSLIPGQWVVLIGNNLKSATQISFNGIPANYNGTLFSDTSAVVQVPSIIPFPSIPAEQMNTIHYVTLEGATTFTFNIVAPPPTIASISNEMAKAGDSVYIYGLNFFLIQSVSFANTPITNYSASNDGTSIRFILPALTQSGPVVVKTKSGTATTAFKVNEDTNGVLCNFDNVNTFSWGTYTENNSSNFPGNSGYYAVLGNDVMNSGDFSWWNWQRSINTNGVQWVPVDSLGVAIDNYALKFELNVPKDWLGVSLFVVKDYSWDYLARYEPWKSTAGNSAFKTNGWRTITIPLSSFRKKGSDGKDGTGVAATSLIQLLGNAGNGSVNIYSINDASSASATGLTAAIDNIRVVKIK